MSLYFSSVYKLCITFWNCQQKVVEVYVLTNIVFFVLVFFFLSNKIGKYSSTYRIEKQEIQNEILVIVC